MANIESTSAFVKRLAHLREAPEEFWKRLDVVVAYALRDTFVHGMPSVVPFISHYSLTSPAPHDHYHHRHHHRHHHDYYLYPSSSLQDQ